MGHGRDAGPIPYEQPSQQRNRQLQQANNSSPSSKNKTKFQKPIDPTDNIMDVNKVGLLIHEELELSRDLDPEEDLHMDRYVMGRFGRDQFTNSGLIDES